MMNLKVFVDVPTDLRFIRRLERDLCERGRSVKYVSRQYLDSVRPMHEKFVGPSRQHADIIIPGGGQSTSYSAVVSTFYKHFQKNNISTLQNRFASLLIKFPFQ